MGISVERLSPWAQRQVLQKLTAMEAQKKAAKESKYHNKPTERVTSTGAVLRFDSQKEARRYDELMVMLQAGQIRDLRLQVDFTLQEAYTDSAGKRVRAIRYKADFTYRKDYSLVVEDVKSRATMTKQYIMKRKMMKDRLGIDIQEV